MVTENLFCYQTHPSPLGKRKGLLEVLRLLSVPECGEHGRFEKDEPCCPGCREEVNEALP